MLELCVQSSTRPKTATHSREPTCEPTQSILSRLRLECSGLDNPVDSCHAAVMRASRAGCKDATNQGEIMLRTKNRPESTRSAIMRRAAITGGMLLLAGFMTVLPGATLDSASAATPPEVELCNGVLNVDATTVECHVVVANTFDVATGVGSAVVTTTICAGAPGAAVCGPATIANYGAVITSVVQCNGSGNAGGSVVVCDVSIANTITGSVAVTAGTVNQCVGSGEGGGATPLNCGPPQSSSGATLTQCNGSGNGGGGDLRVTCSFGAITETSALRVTINQCNGSGNGGGATVTCSASETTTVIPAATGGTGQPGATPPTAVRNLAESGNAQELWPIGLVGAITVLLGTSLLLHAARRREQQPLS